MGSDLLLGEKYLFKKHTCPDLLSDEVNNVELSLNLSGTFTLNKPFTLLKTTAKALAESDGEELTDGERL